MYIYSDLLIGEGHLHCIIFKSSHLCNHHSLVVIYISCLVYIIYSQIVYTIVITYVYTPTPLQNALYLHQHTLLFC